LRINRRPDRLAQPFHCELVIGRLQQPPAFDLGLITVLWEVREVFADQSPAGGPLSREFLSDIVRFGKCGLSVPALPFDPSASVALAKALASRSF
jgi:hypothetical protein